MKVLDFETTRRPITIDWNLSWREMIELMQVKWNGQIPYNQLTRKEAGTEEHDCYFLTVVAKNGTDFRTVQRICEKHKIQLATPAHLLSFGGKYPEQCSAENNGTILAGGETWLDSHECVDEMAGLSWCYFYHSPGRELSTECDLGEPSFKQGTRFLAVA